MTSLSDPVIIDHYARLGGVEPVVENESHHYLKKFQDQYIHGWEMLHF